MNNLLHMLLPFIVLCCGGMVCVVLGVAKSEGLRRRICNVALLTIVVSLAFSVYEYYRLGFGGVGV